MKWIKVVIIICSLLFIVSKLFASPPGWTEERRITDNLGYDYSVAPHIASDGIVTLHLVWSDYRSWPPKIYYKKSTDGGNTWTADMQLSDENSYTLTSNDCVAVAVDKKKYVHVVWTDHRDSTGTWEVYYRRSIDGGNAWSSDTRITSNSISDKVDIAVDSNDWLHLIWEDAKDGNWELYYKRSIDGGNSWGQEVRLTNEPDVSVFRSMDIDEESNIHLTWHNGVDDHSEIFYKKFDSRSETWSNNVRLTTGTIHSFWPYIVTIGKTLHLFFSKRSIGSYITTGVYYKKSNDGGETWSSETTISTQTNISFLIVATKDVENNLHLFWTNETTSGIWYKKSTDLGNSWDAETLLFVLDGGDYPTATADSSGVHLVVDNFGLYYTKYNPLWAKLEEEKKVSYLFILPNPFRPEKDGKVKIVYKLPWKDLPLTPKVTIRIYSLVGELIKTLVDKEEKYSPWTYEVYWDGKNDSGEVVASGVYLIHYSVPLDVHTTGGIISSVNEIKKLALIK